MATLQLLSQYWVPHLQEAVSCAPKGLVLHPAAAHVVSAENERRLDLWDDIDRGSPQPGVR